MIPPESASSNPSEAAIRELTGLVRELLAQLHSGLVTPAAVNTKQAACIVGFSPSMLTRYRHSKQGPLFFQRGRAIRYRVEDLHQWLADGIVKSRS